MESFFQKSWCQQLPAAALRGSCLPLSESGRQVFISAVSNERRARRSLILRWGTLSLHNNKHERHRGAAGFPLSTEKDGIHKHGYISGAPACWSEHQRVRGGNGRVSAHTNTDPTHRHNLLLPCRRAPFIVGITIPQMQTRSLVRCKRTCWQTQTSLALDGRGGLGTFLRKDGSRDTLHGAYLG